MTEFNGTFDWHVRSMISYFHADLCILVEIDDIWRSWLTESVIW